jgi:hypothetical protein
MMDLPTSACLPANLSAAFSLPVLEEPERGAGEKQQFLLQAFRSFAEAADSLERSYGMLRSEVARLHGELEQSNAGWSEASKRTAEMRRASGPHSRWPALRRAGGGVRRRNLAG